MGKTMLNNICYGSDSATDINYDNTSSGMSATNTQDAIDELNESLNKVNIYVGNDNKLHFVDNEGADSVLPFKSESFYIGTKGQYNPAGTYKFKIDLTGTYLITGYHNGGSLYTCWVIENGKITEKYEGSNKTDTYKFTATINGTALSLTATGISYYSYRWCGNKDLIDIPTTSLSGTQSVSFMGGGSDSVSYNITFSSAFSTIPTITLSPTWTSNGGWVDYVQAKNVTKTGFTLFVQSKGGASSGKGIVGKVSWVASV